MSEYNHHQHREEEPFEFQGSSPASYESTERHDLPDLRKEDGENTLEDSEEVISSEFEDKLLVYDSNPRFHERDDDDDDDGVLRSKGEHKEEEEEEDKFEDTHVPVENLHVEDEEVGDDVDYPPPSATEVAAEGEGEKGKEKKGLLEKIKDKIPGFNSKPSSQEVN